MATQPVPLNLSLSYGDRTVRTVGTDERPEWVAADVCAVLGLENVTRAIATIPADECGSLTLENITEGKPGRRTVVTVTEAGLYRLIFKSRKDEAKAFQRWVFHEVLPSIRKYGTYPAPADGRPVAGGVSMTEVRALVAAAVSEALASVLAQVGTGPRLPGPFWTVASWLEENMPEWDTTRAQRHQIGQDARRRVTRENPKDVVGYFNRDLAFLAHQEIHLARAAQKAYRKAVREGALRTAPRLFDPEAA